MITSRTIGHIRWAALFFCAAAILGMRIPAGAAYLRDVPQTLQQPNGSVLECFASGDEFYNWLHDADGYTIIQDPKTGYYTYAAEVNGDVVPTEHIVGKDLPSRMGLTKYARLSDQKYDEKLKERESIGPLPGAPILPAAPTKGTIRNLVVFIRFSGESNFGDPISIYDNMFNATTAGASSLRNYYYEVSYQQLTITSTFYPAASGGMVMSYQDSQPRGYYQPYSGLNPIGYTNDAAAREWTLIRNAVNSIASQVPSNLVIDYDGDGKIDNICFIISGSPDGWANLLWPHWWSYGGTATYINGKQVADYDFQLQSSLSPHGGVGVLCHEMFHSLHAPDLYHYSHEGPTPVGAWDIMEWDQNPPQHMSAYMKWRYGKWIADPPVATLGSGATYYVNPLTSSTGNWYRINSPYSSTEYFVVEYRKKEGTFESSLPGSGLLVWRVNTARDGKGNKDGPPDELYVYRPGGNTYSTGRLDRAHFTSDVGRTEINQYTDPTPFLSSGSNGGLALCDISACGAQISFRTAAKVTKPSFSPSGGVLSLTSREVRVYCGTPGATIRYTTNGTTPTESSPIIASGGQVVFSSDGWLKARAYKSGMETSQVTSVYYRIVPRLYVKWDSQGPVLDGLSWSTAFRTVEDAMEIAVPGHEIWVARGNYSENLVLKDGIGLYGGFSGNETLLSQRNWIKNPTILDGGGKGSVVRVESFSTSQTALDGFTIRNGSGNLDFSAIARGGGIYIGMDAEPRIANNKIIDNQAEEGGGIFSYDESVPRIYNNVIHDNWADRGAGIYSYWGYPEIINNTIANNYAFEDGGGIYCKNYTMGSPKISNNLIAWNTSGIFLEEGQLGVFTNNCLYGNIYYAYSGVANQTGLNGNIATNPNCIDSSWDNYHLQSNSPCIDAGTATGAPVKDYDGGKRPWDGDRNGTAQYDIGAYEFRRVHVKYNSPSPSDGSTWAKAYHTVQAALNAAHYTDEVWVAAGTYTENITLKDGVALLGGFMGTETSLDSRKWADNVTVLDGGHSGVVVTFPAYSMESTRIDGFTIRNGSNDTMSGGGEGGGVYCGNQSRGTIQNNTITDNWAEGDGGGIHCEGSAVRIVNNLIKNNSAWDTGGGISFSHCEASFACSYNTIVGNTADSGGGGISTYQSVPTISSNIIVWNDSGILSDSDYPYITRNNIYGNTAYDVQGYTLNPSLGNISADPMFLDPDQGDYHLTDGSPCVDTAKHSDAPDHDIDGRSRPYDGNGDGAIFALADMGAYEYRRIFVKPGNPSVMDGSEWSRAFTTVAQGLAEARAGDEVWVAAGTYVGSITLVNGAALYGGFAGTETMRAQRNLMNKPILDANQSGRVVTAPIGSRRTTRIDGFTIRNGLTNLVGAGIFVASGGSPTIENNVITGNRSTGMIGSASGGGIYSSGGSPRIANNIISDNAASGTTKGGTYLGGGLYCYGGNPVVVNNTIVGNSAGSTLYPGSGGGIYLADSGPNLTNNIIAFNSFGGICRAGTGTYSLNRNDVFGNGSYQYSGFAGTGTDISLDPLFVDMSAGNYHLLPGSPCIDGGASAVLVPDSDIDGTARPIDGNGDGVASHDIGAYEHAMVFTGIKDLPDNSPVVLSGLSVTAIFPGMIYVEKPDRSSGIQVTTTGTFTEGQVVSISGIMKTGVFTGERYIQADTGSPAPTGATLVLKPVGMQNKTLGGTQFGLQPGVPGGSGLNNIGLLVTTWGRVTYSSGQYFNIDDGSGVTSAGSPGIRVYAANGISVPAVGQFVEVNGVSSIGWGIYTPKHRLLQVWRQNDIIIRAR